MNLEQILQDVRTTYEYSYLHDEWIEPILSLIEHVSVEEAAWRYEPEAKSIAEIVLHVAVWNENIVERIRTAEKSSPAEGAWPPEPQPLTETAWAEIRARLQRSIEELRQFLEEVDWAQIDQSPYGLPDLLLRFVHIGYHAGQIVKIREFYHLRQVQ